MNAIESASSFYPPDLVANNASMYHPMNHVPYPNMPNGPASWKHDDRFPMHQQQQQQAPFNRGVDVAAAKAAFDMERLDKSQYQANSNSGSSSDSDDSNNNSDSSSAESNVDKDNKENSQRVVKPFRLNFKKVGIIIAFSLSFKF